VKLSIAFLSAFLMSSVMSLASAGQDLDSLGGNRDLIRRAKGISPENTVQVVQNRSVNRHWRTEWGLNVGTIAGGDPYVKTNNLGGHFDLHVNPRFSVGARYYAASNQLSNEGKRVFDQADEDRANGGNTPRPDINYARSTILGVVNWYPFYGKINLLDWSIVQFDIYLLAGGGQIQLASGGAPVYTGGGGIAFWLNNYFSTRFEARYQTYQDQMASGSSRRLDQTILSATIGFLL
jgi:outer membrane immunogenic protein